MIIHLWLCHRVFFLHKFRNIHQHTQLSAIKPLDWFTTLTKKQAITLYTVSERFNQLFEKNINCASQTSPLIKQLINEYDSSINSIVKNDYNSTPLTYIYRFIVGNVVHNLIESITAVTNSITWFFFFLLFKFTYS